MRRAGLAVLLIAAVSAGAVPARAEIAFKLPPPAVVGLVPLAALPLDKPQVPVPPVGAPAPALAIPELPSPRLVSDLAQRPVAPMASPRMLACNPVGTLFGVASEMLECGRARYQKGELESARQAFQTATQGDRDVAREARYWLGETLLRLGRSAEADRTFQLVTQQNARGELGAFALDGQGFIALEAGDPARALGYFDTLLKAPMPIPLIPYARHGRALALYGLKRYPEARDGWVPLLSSNPPPPLAAEVSFWLGDTLGRLGDHAGAVSRLSGFTAARPQLLGDAGLLSLGWWSRAAGQPKEAAGAYRALLAQYPRATVEGMWAHAGLALALLDLDDYTAAREEAKRVEQLDRTGGLAIPVLLQMRRWAAEKSHPDEARALDTELLARNLDPVTRAWVLAMSAELARQSGSPGEARDQIEVIRSGAAPATLKQFAELRAAQLEFDARSFADAQATAQKLLAQSIGDDVRAAALVIAGEAAYWARDYGQATAHYGRFLSEFGSRPEAPVVGLALGWAEFRRGHLDAARERWIAYANAAGGDPRAAEAVLLSAELAARSGDAAQTRALLDRIVSRYPGTDAADVAVLNRAILAVNAGRAAESLIELSRLEGRPTTSPSLGRVRVTRAVALLAYGKAADAEAAFKGALGHGDDALAHLGLGVVAFGHGQWDVATREFTEARDAGLPNVATAAEYGLAATAFDAGKLDEFKKLASPLLAGPADPVRTPRLLHATGAVAAEERRWTDARAAARRLVDQYPRDDATPEAVAGLGAAAAANAEWALAREMYQVLDTRYPNNAGRQAGRVAYGEALLRTGSPAEARRELELFTATALPGDPRRTRALSLLAEAQEATGDRTAAAQTYTRFATESSNGKEASGALLAAARLLQQDRKWDDARWLLVRVLKDADGAAAAEAAYRLGEGLAAADQHGEAVEAYMTAAYIMPDSVWARRALVGAGRSFAAAKQNDAAAIVYRKLLAASSVEPELANAARSGLKALGVN